MKYNFDQVIDRSNTFPSKWERYSQRFAGYEIDEKNALSMRVADMDFKCMPEIMEALHKRIDHGLFGYSNENVNVMYRGAACRWYQRRYGWECQPEWMLFSFGVVSAINATIQEFTREGEGVIIQSPVYYPFAAGIKNNNRVIYDNKLVEAEGRFQINFEELEMLAAKSECKLMILCTPHNPVARVWTREELERVLKICHSNGVMVFCDEIHGDLIMPGVTFTSAGQFPEYYDSLVMVHSPSKTFNLAGLCAAMLTVPNAQNRARLSNRIYQINRIPTTQNLGPIADTAAFDKGVPCVNVVRAYIRGNVDYAKAFLAENLPGIRIVEPEGTYLIWFDMRGLGLDTETLHKKVLEEAGVIGDLGRWFGDDSDGFMRFNYACPRSFIEEQMRRFAKVFQK